MSPDPDDSPDTGAVVEVVVGRIGRAHGIRGDVTIDVRTDEPDRRFVVGAVLRARPPRGAASATGTPSQLTVAGLRWHSSKLLVTFAEIADRTAAEAARGTLLHVDIPAGETPDDPDEFYDHQLVGLAVHDLDGTLLGEVTSLVHGGAQDLLAVRTPDGPRHPGAVRHRAGARGGHRRWTGRGGRPARPGDPARRDLSRGPDPQPCASTTSRSSRTTSPRCRCRCPGGRSRPGSSTSTSTTCVGGPTTGTAPSTTRPPAAGPAW